MNPWGRQVCQSPEIQRQTTIDTKGIPPLMDTNIEMIKSRTKIITIGCENYIQNIIVTNLSIKFQKKMFFFSNGCSKTNQCNSVSITLVADVITDSPTPAKLSIIISIVFLVP